MLLVVGFAARFVIDLLLVLFFAGETISVWTLRKHARRTYAVDMVKEGFYQYEIGMMECLVRKIDVSLECCVIVVVNSIFF